MRALLVLVPVFAALAAAAAAAGGGWATVGVEPLPGDVRAGETWSPNVTVLRHGRTPTDGAKPTVTITSSTGERRTFAAEPTGRTGVYQAKVLFPSAGTWRFAVDNGLEATGYGMSQTTSFAAVEIASRDDDSSWLPRWTLLGGLAAVAAAAAVVLGSRRLRRPLPA